MKGSTANAVVGGLGGAACVAALTWLWLLAPWVSPWPVVAMAAVLLAAAVVWSLVPGKATDGWWALAAAAVVTAEAFAEYLWLPTDSVWMRGSAWAASAAVVSFSQLRDGSLWRTGLRVGLGAGVLAATGLTLVFGAAVGTPEQATVLEAGGALARFESSSATDFLVWSVEDFWRSLSVLLIASSAVGAFLGFVARRIKTSS